MRGRLARYGVAYAPGTWLDGRMAPTGLAHSKTAAAALTVLAACLLIAPPLVASDLDEFKVKRQQVFEFAQKPTVRRHGDSVSVQFATKAFCDVTVAVEDSSLTAGGRPRIIRHLASGVLGRNAPAPSFRAFFRSGTTTL